MRYGARHKENVHIYVLDPTGVGHHYDPLASKSSEDALYSSAAHLLHQPEGQDIFTQRATKLLACLFAPAKRQEGAALPYARMLRRTGRPGCVERLHAVDPVLPTISSDSDQHHATLDD